MASLKGLLAPRLAPPAPLPPPPIVELPPLVPTGLVIVGGPVFDCIVAVWILPVEPCVLAIFAASAKLFPTVAPPEEPFAFGDILEKRVAFIAPAVVKPNWRGWWSVLTF